VLVIRRIHVTYHLKLKPDQQVHENPLEWKLDVAVKAGDRIGLFGRDMAALVV
jgi:hypothetical protein